jgi:hypothetical protein
MGISFDFIISISFLIGLTYSLCSPDYFFQFTLNNLLHLIFTCYSTTHPETLNLNFTVILDTVFITRSIIIIYFGWAVNIYQSLTLGYNSLGAQIFPFLDKYGVQIHPAVYYFIHKDAMVGTIIMGVIPPLLIQVNHQITGIILGIISGFSGIPGKKETGKTPLQKEMKEKRIIREMVLSTLAQYPKFILFKSLFINEYWAILMGGSITYLLMDWFGGQSPSVIYLVSALIGAANNMAYYWLGNVEFEPLFLAAVAVELLGGWMKEVAINYVEKGNKKITPHKKKRIKVLFGTT